MVNSNRVFNQRPNLMSSVSGLSPAEQEAMKKYNHEMAKAAGLKTDEVETVTKVRYDEDTAKLREEVEALKDKLKDLKDEREDLRKERDDYRTRFDKKRGELANVQEENDALKRDLHAANDELAELRKRPKAAPVRDESEIIRLKKDLRQMETERDSARDALSKANSDLDDAAERLSALETEKNGLESRLLDAKNSLLEFQTPVIPEAEPVGKVSMVSPTSLRSDLFTSHRYSVRIAKDMSYVKFEPSAEGHVFCNDRTMDIPRLPEYIPYTEGAEFQMLMFDGTLMVKL